MSRIPPEDFPPRVGQVHQLRRTLEEIREELDERIARRAREDTLVYVKRPRYRLTGRDLIMLTIGFWVGELLLIAVLCLK